jgi:hypothetical protein
MPIATRIWQALSRAASTRQASETIVVYLTNGTSTNRGGSHHDKDRPGSTTDFTLWDADFTTSIFSGMFGARWTDSEFDFIEVLSEDASDTDPAKTALDLFIYVHPRTGPSQFQPRLQF